MALSCLFLSFLEVFDNVAPEKAPGSISFGSLGHFGDFPKNNKNSGKNSASPRSGQTGALFINININILSPPTRVNNSQ